MFIDFSSWLPFHWVSAAWEKALNIFPYLYEVIGGVLIFVSSHVTERALPKERRARFYWLLFGIAALAYAGFGIEIRHRQIEQEREDTGEARQERREARESRAALEKRTNEIWDAALQSYLKISGVQSDMARLQAAIASSNRKEDPRKIADLQSVAASTKQRADALSRELLVLTMTPQIAHKLRDWEGTKKQRIQDLHNWEYEEQLHFMQDHPNDPGVNKLIADWEKKYQDAEDKAVANLKDIVSSADFVRKEMLLLIPQHFPNDDAEAKAFTEAQSDPQLLSRDRAADYLESLAQRVPPPK